MKLSGLGGKLALILVPILYAVTPYVSLTVKVKDPVAIVTGDTEVKPKYPAPGMPLEPVNPIAS